MLSLLRASFRLASRLLTGWTPHLSKHSSCVLKIDLLAVASEVYGGGGRGGGGGGEGKKWRK